MHERAHAAGYGEWGAYVLPLLGLRRPSCRVCLLADVPAIIGSIDVVMGEVDR